MQQLGATVAITCLLGVPLMGLIGLGVPIRMGAALWVALGLLLVGLNVWYYGGVGPWWREPIHMPTDTQAIVVFCAGMLFATGGASMIAFGQPTKNPRAMNRNEIMFFGSIFLITGLGLGGVSLPGKPREPPSESKHRKMGGRKRGRRNGA